MKYYAIIVAGGKGNRMQQNVAKQFLILNGKPVLMHTMEAFHKCVLNPEIILVLNTQQHGYWAELCASYQFTIPHLVIEGGAERFDSVKNGLGVIDSEGLVAVHDAVRPLVTPELIQRSYEMAAEKGNAITAIQAVDSVRRKLANGESEALDRNELYLVQTPQTFHIGQLRKAYNQAYRTAFTDDASVVEKAGFSIHLLEGERNNLKITYAQDLELAALFLKKEGF